MRQTWLALKAWLFLFVSELFNPLGFLIAGFVGFTINIVQSGKAFSSWIAYLVPVLVQAFSRALLRYSQRHRETLLRLPAERLDPTFVMDAQGKILASAGNTLSFLKKTQAKTFEELFTFDEPHPLAFQVKPLFVTCPANGKSYAVTIQKSQSDYLVWCDEIKKEG